MPLIKEKISNYLLPVCGLFFLVFYLFGTTLYPGGSEKNLSSKGFDWFNNYWCDLMGHTAINTAPNPAKTYAILALFSLCSATLFFFISFANKLVLNKIHRRIIKASAVGSMIFAAFIFTDFHDQFIIISCLFGAVAVIGVAWEMARSNLKCYQLTGVLCVFLLCLNNLIYYSGVFLDSLPIIQKITLVLLLAWMTGLNLIKLSI